MLGQEEKDNLLSGSRAGLWKTFCRSASWSPRSPNSNSNSNPNPRPQNRPNPKSRASLPPLQPLSISRRDIVDQWPKAGSDDLGEWPHPPSTPNAQRDSLKPSSNSNPIGNGGGFLMKKDKLAFFNKECSRIADHIYLGSDAVARNREELRRHGITHVLNCVGFVCPEYFRGELVYKTLWLQDSPTEDITSILYDVFDYFEEVREGGGRVFVHCCQGVSRSTSLVIAYLMWHQGQSFDDAFLFVKAARGITNPNMGFACQLLQCQKRVHASPISPTSALRVSRIAPHSSYDPLHLVPKLLPQPSAAALDSRGAFLVHVPSAVYVWIGKNCSTTMSRSAWTAAYQVFRYERAKRPVGIQEGEEPAEFWDALAFSPLFVDGLDKSGNNQVATVMNVGIGRKKVDAYDVDFELFQRALRGGVVPPFPLPGTGFETRLPARENGWDRLRQKLASGAMRELVTASLTSKKVPAVDTCEVEEAPLNRFVDSSLSPSPSPSPACHSTKSFCSDSDTSSKLSSKSPSPSPTDSSSSSIFSPTSNWSEFSFSSSQSSPTVSELTDLFATKPSREEKAHLPCKWSSPSLAERRGSNAPSLMLSSSDDQSKVSRNIGRSWSFSLPSLEEDALTDHVFQGLEFESSHELGADKGENIQVQLSDHKEMDELHFRANCSTGESISPQLADTVMEDHEPPVSNDLVDGVSDLTHPIMFQWPTMEKVEMFRAGILDSRSVFLLLAPTMDLSNRKAKTLHVSVGCDVAYDEVANHLIAGSSTDDDRRKYWEKVGSDFLYQMGLPVDIPVQVVRELDEPMQFLTHFNSS